MIGYVPVVSHLNQPPSPHPNSRIVYNVDANILFKVCDVWFWEAARYSEDDEIQINNALIWVLQDLS